MYEIRFFKKEAHLIACKDPILAHYMYKPEQSANVLLMSLLPSATLQLEAMKHQGRKQGKGKEGGVERLSLGDETRCLKQIL